MYRKCILPFSNTIISLSLSLLLSLATAVAPPATPRLSMSVFSYFPSSYPPFNLTLYCTNQLFHSSGAVSCISPFPAFHRLSLLYYRLLPAFCDLVTFPALLTELTGIRAFIIIGRHFFNHRPILRSFLCRHIIIYYRRCAMNPMELLLIKNSCDTFVKTIRNFRCFECRLSKRPGRKAIL